MLRQRRRAARRRHELCEQVGVRLAPLIVCERDRSGHSRECLSHGLPRRLPHRAWFVADRHHRREPRGSPRRKERRGRSTVATTAVEAMNGSAPRSRISNTRTSAHAATTTATPPIAAPIAAIFNPSPTTMRSRSRPTAPSAIRVPISTVACRTEYRRPRRCQEMPSTAPRARRRPS